MPNTLVRARNTASSRQLGRCFYCDLPMCSGDPREFALKHNVTPRQANLLRCTGEHLVARQDGGTASTSNIVAACWLCNSRRHRRKNAPPPDRYKQLVRRRMSQGRWHYPWVYEHLRGICSA